MLKEKNIKVIKLLTVALLFILSISQIYNTPGSPFLEYYQKLKSAPLQLLFLSGIINIFNKNVGGLFYESVAWATYKFALFFVFLANLGILIHFRELFKIKSKLDIALYYFGSVTLMLLNLSYPYPDILSSPFFILSIIFLIKGKSKSIPLFLVSMLFSYNLLIFIPIYLKQLLKNKIKKPILGLVVLLTILSFFPFLEDKGSFVFNFYYLIEKILSPLIILKSSNIISTILLFVFCAFYLRISKIAKISTLLTIALAYLALFPRPNSSMLYFAALLSLLVVLINPSTKNKIYLMTLNLFSFVNMFLLNGTAGVNNLRGVTYELFLLFIVALTSFYYLKSLKLNVKSLKKLGAMLLVLSSLALFTADGSPDTVAWAEYAKATAENLNPFYAQTLVDQRYPPLSTVIISVFSNIWKHTLGFSTATTGHVLSQDYSFSTKLGTVTIYYLTVFLLIKLFNKKRGNITSFIFTILTVFSIFIQTHGLADINVYVIPTFLISSVYLFKKKYLLAGIFMGLTISIKWQPIILLPLFFATTVQLNKVRNSVKNSISFLTGLVPPALISWLLVISQPGGKDAFDRAFYFLKNGAPMLSGQALNLNWIVTYFIHVTKPSEVYSIATLGDLNRQVFTEFAPKIFQGQLFLIGGALVVIIYWVLAKKTLANFFAGCAMTFFTHQELNRSAYEKHIFYVAFFILVFYLLKQNKGNKILLTIIDLMTIINLIFFYGFVGAKDVNRLFLGVDLTLIFSFLYVVIYFYFLYLYIKSKGSFFG